VFVIKVRKVRVLKFSVQLDQQSSHRTEIIQIVTFSSHHHNVIISNGLKKNLAPAALQKQLQACIAIHGMSWVYEMDTMKLTQVHQKLFDGFHGNASNGTLPMVKDCLEGENAFESLWDKIVSDTGPQLFLKSCYTQQEDQLYTASSSFTVVSVSATNQKSNVVVNGRAIFNMAQSALKNGKKALAIEQSAYVNGKLPSGWN
jgi:hypothetical protein